MARVMVVGRGGCGEGVGGWEGWLWCGTVLRYGGEW